MSGTAGTIRGTTSGRNTGRGKLPDFDNSYIPRPKSESPSTHNHHNNHHTAGSDVGSTAMSTTTRQRQNQSKRDEVAFSPVLSVFARSFTDMFSRGGKSIVGYSTEVGGGPQQEEAYDQEAQSLS